MSYSYMMVKTGKYSSTCNPKKRSKTVILFTTSLTCKYTRNTLVYKNKRNPSKDRYISNQHTIRKRIDEIFDGLPKGLTTIVKN